MLEKIIVDWESEWKKVRKLGGGAQGTTYLLASLHDPSQLSVLKTLNNAKSEQARLRFQREILSLIELSRLTTSVPKVIAHSVETADKPFFVMEFVLGNTLQDYVSERGTLSLEESLFFCRQLCETLKTAHRVPILHRDLKPDNIIIKDGDQPKLVLVDFGLAFISTSPVTETKDTFRNRFLLLPEMASGGQDKRDYRSDLTSVVALFYFCLSGRNPEQLMDASGLKPHRSHPLRIAGLDQKSLQHVSWLTFFDKGFEYKVEDRFQSIDEMQHEIDTIGTYVHRSKAVTIEQAAGDAISQLRARNHRQFWIDEHKPKLEVFWRKLHQYFDSHSQKAIGFKISSFTGGPASPVANFDSQFAGGFLFFVENFNPTACIRYSVGFLDRQVAVFVGMHSSASNHGFYTDPKEVVHWRIVAKGSVDDLTSIELSDLDDWISDAITESLTWVADTINGSDSPMHGT